MGAALCCSACTSVLATINSTPSSPTCTMRLTALLPPPPTPTTLMRAPVRCSSASFSRNGISRVSAIRPPLLEEFLEQAAQPSGDAPECAGAHQTPGIAHMMPLRVQPQSHSRGELRIADVVGEAANADRHPAPDREIEDLLSKLGHSLENCTASGQHDARVERLLVSGAPNLIPHLVTNLLSARLQNLRQHTPRHESRLSSTHARH